MVIQFLPGCRICQYLTACIIASAIPAAVLYLRFMLGIASKSVQSGMGGTSANNSLIEHFHYYVFVLLHVQFC